MKFFDHFRKKGSDQGIRRPADRQEKLWESVYETVRRLEITGYHAQYLDVCKQIWKEKVPASGQADTLQGELLRQVEKLSHEACDNGNVNWDEDFAWFCDFLQETFEKSHALDETRLEKTTELLRAIKRAGEYAADLSAGRIAEQDADPNRIAYTEDDLYEYLLDSVAIFALKHPQAIPYQPKDFLHR